METALVLPVLLILLLGLVELGRALHAYHALEKAVRGAARYVARVPASAPDIGARIAHAQTMASAELEQAGLGNLQITVTQPAAGVAWITASGAITREYPFLGYIGINPTIRFQASHEQPHLGL